MFTFKKITKEDKNKWIELMHTVLENLKRKEFFIPFNEAEIEEIFEENRAIHMGAYDEEKLVGACTLYLDETYVKEIKEKLGLQSDKVIELGGYLVLEEYRNQGIIKSLEMLLVEEAKRLDYEYIVITVHPENTASNKATEFTGAKLVKTANLGEYLRNIWVLDLREV